MQQTITEEPKDFTKVCYNTAENDESSTEHMF